MPECRRPAHGSHPGCELVVGPMASGKTSLLKASSGLAVLVLLASGRTAAQVADVTTWSRRRVVGLATRRGWGYDPESDTVTAPLAARLAKAAA